MFCPQCGKECGEGHGFCLSCGCKLDVGEANQGVGNNLYSQDFQGMNSVPAEPVSQMQSTANDNSFMSAQSALPYDTVGVKVSNKSSGVKKGIIIGVIALLVALLGVFGFLFIRNKLERDYLVNNPTKYVFSSYQTYFDKANSDPNDLFAILNNCKEQGSVKISAETPTSDGKNQASDIQISYNAPEKKYYLKVGGSNVRVKADTVGTALFELYTDINRIDFNIQTDDKQGKYYIDSGKIREQAGNSIFSPDKDNVLNIDREQFNQFMDQFESIYRNLLSDNAQKDKSEELFNSMLKKIEQDCNVTVEEGTTTVNGKDVPVDTVTYTLDYNSMLAVLNDVKAELVDYAANNKELFDNYDESIQNLNEAFDKLISEFTESEQAKNIVIVAKNHMSKDSKEIAKLALEFKVTGQTAASMKFSLEFSRDPYMNIGFNVSNGIFSAGASLYKEVNGQVISYVLSTSSNTSESDTKQEIARLDYDDANNKLTLTAGGTSYSCDAEVGSDKVTLSFDIPGATTSSDSGKIKIEISSVPDMNVINAEKNLFDINKEEYEDLFGEFDNQNTDIYDYDTDYGYDSDYDYNYDYDYDYDYDSDYDYNGDYLYDYDNDYNYTTAVCAPFYV